MNFTAEQARVFEPGEIGPLRLRNRILRTGAFEGMTPDGVPSDALVEHHRRMAAGGVALTTVAYCSVAHDGLTFGGQMWARPEIVPQLGRLSGAVHQEGGLCALQLGHAGYFANPEATGVKPLGASAQVCLYTLSRSRQMSLEDIRRLTDDYGRAAGLAREAGFDAVELHLAHGYLLSQFLSPHTNHRKDGYGGSLDNRLRFPLEALARVREAAGPGMAVLAKINLEDGFRGGLELAEAVEVARRLEASGLADALVLSGGFVSKTPFFMLRGELPVTEMVANEKHFTRRVSMRMFARAIVEEYPFEPLFFMPAAMSVRRALKLPLVLVGGMRSLDHLSEARAAGFDFLALGRPLIHDPDFVNRLARGEITASPCEPCNKCIAEMENGGVRCAHPTLGQPRAR
ncbi:MAG TPA: NADH:flavin oxidoreductase [Myxococcota bacterium]|nr:NADH:flavin oxidoreductase [Myxococcota bacterium]HRY94739.1 NADH:flavin oxidoreductase [Myxococcota bacterium]HSA20038.1 NADH:flavin oxidoreductase [Myxococcota bacterium]